MEVLFVDKVVKNSPATFFFLRRDVIGIEAVGGSAGAGGVLSNKSDRPVNLAGEG